MTDYAVSMFCEWIHMENLSESPFEYIWASNRGKFRLAALRSSNQFSIMVYIFSIVVNSMRETSATDTHRLQCELIVPTSPEQTLFSLHCFSIDSIVDFPRARSASFLLLSRIENKRVIYAWQVDEFHSQCVASCEPVTLRWEMCASIMPDVVICNRV